MSPKDFAVRFVSEHHPMWVVDLVTRALEGYADRKIGSIAEFESEIHSLGDKAAEHLRRSGWDYCPERGWQKGRAIVDFAFACSMQKREESISSRRPKCSLSAEFCDDEDIMALKFRRASRDWLTALNKPERCQIHETWMEDECKAKPAPTAEDDDLINGRCDGLNSQPPPPPAPTAEEAAKAAIKTWFGVDAIEPEGDAESGQEFFIKIGDDEPEEEATLPSPEELAKDLASSLGEKLFGRLCLYLYVRRD